MVDRELVRKESRGVFIDANRVVLENGFDPGTWDNLLSKLMCVVTEVVELVDGAVSGAGEDNLHEEIADTAIRLGCILVDTFPSEWELRFHIKSPVPSRYWGEPAVLVWPVVSYLGKAAEYWRYNNRSDCRVAIELALKEVYKIAEWLHVDLFGEIRRKTAINAKRGHLHGKANTVG